MWTEATRAQHCRAGERYASDLTDAEWAVLAPLMPTARRGGRPRTTDMRAVMNAQLYLLRTGCQWRMLPKDFPPFTTVQHYFYSLARQRPVARDARNAGRAHARGHRARDRQRGRPMGLRCARRSE